jgi:hypothetical protein
VPAISASEPCPAGFTAAAVSVVTVATAVTNRMEDSVKLTDTQLAHDGAALPTPFNHYLVGKRQPPSRVPTKMKAA